MKLNRFWFCNRMNTRTPTKTLFAECKLILQWFIAVHIFSLAVFATFIDRQLIVISNMVTKLDVNNGKRSSRWRKKINPRFSAKGIYMYTNLSLNARCTPCISNTYENSNLVKNRWKQPTNIQLLKYVEKKLQYKICWTGKLQSELQIKSPFKANLRCYTFELNHIRLVYACEYVLYECWCNVYSAVIARRSERDYESPTVIEPCVYYCVMHTRLRLFIAHFNAQCTNHKLLPL